MVRHCCGEGSRGRYWVEDLLKQTWTTDGQQAYIYIHHKTILYIDIWASSPGRILRVGTKERPGEKRDVEHEGMSG